MPYTPAFPTSPNQQPGLSTRDYFAIHILQGMCAAATSFRSQTDANVARVAYELADALIEEGAKPIAIPEQPMAKPAPEEV
jgi:hypothetical protein